jgi:pyrrolysine biosynthesis protein PylC
VKLGIIGGKLQGMEAAFLARQAGWETVLVDKSPCPPANGLCDSFYQCDVVKDMAYLCRLIEENGVDFIVPALEDLLALRSLEKCSGALGIPLAYDAAAYSITSSKKRSNLLFERLGISMPLSWPRCGFPLIAKPSVSSGSQGVIRIDNEKVLDRFLGRIGSDVEGWVLQEYIDGPSYSIEVLGTGSDYTALQVTELQMDAHYDCKRVIAPAVISASLEQQIREIAITIARSIHLKGIMDVELVLDRNVLKVFEIDARLPSQTPAAVYSSTGINMLEMLGEIFTKDTFKPVPQLSEIKSVVYEHINGSVNKIDILGEHIMTSSGPLEMNPGFFGADIGITNFNRGRLPLVATLIVSGSSPEQAWIKHGLVIENIREYLAGGFLESKSGGAGLAAAPVSRG